MPESHRDATRRRWLETLEQYKRHSDTPGSDAYWAPTLDTASRDELIAIQNAKLAALVPFLYESSPFYRRRFERLDLLPTDIKTVDDLPKWPVVDKAEMVEDALAHPPYGTYTTMDEDIWAKRGWMMFSSSGTTGAPRVFRYSQIDRDYWAWANARGLQAMGIGKGDTVLMITHLWQARIVEFYGCTEASPHVGGYSCAAAVGKDGLVTTHLLEDVQVWELVDAETREPVKHGERGLTVCTCLNSESSPQLRFLVGDYTVFDDRVCACGRTQVRAVGAFTRRADDLINLRGIKMYPSQIEEGVRGVSGIGDEYEIVLSTDPSGLDIMTVRVEHPDHEVPDAIAARVAEEVRTRCEVRVGVEVLPPGMLPKTEFKAKRVRDIRSKS